jgi:hypothetical protein
MQEAGFQYSGTELELFEKATNWKSYITSQFKQNISGRVLEVGTGIGAFIPWLMNPNVTQWTCLEPDIKFGELLRQKYSKEISEGKLEVKTGYLKDIPESEKYDTILYLDVLEHIEDDHREMELSFQRLKSNGSIIVLAPALQFLYNEFDKNIGHYRRYNHQSLKCLTPKESKLESIRYFDSAGFMLSLGNKWFLKQSQPKLEQIMFWDKVIVPVSKVVDKMTAHAFGKNIVAIWKKTN